MPISIKRVVGSWFEEDSKLKFDKIKEEKHIKQAIEFAKDEPDKIKLRVGYVVLGRNKECHIILAGKHISDKHCEIKEHGIDIWYVRDLKSNYGTYVQRENAIVKLISGDFRLEVGDRLILGDPQDSKEPATYLQIGEW